MKIVLHYRLKQLKQLEKQMTKRIRQDLLDKLSTQKKHYEKVTGFSDLLPMFGKRIIQNELTVDGYSKLAESHGKLPLSWGANWYTNTPTNYPSETHKEFGFVNVYINTLSLFGDSCAAFARGELAEIRPSIKVHFYDSYNTTFYFLPEEVKDGLDKLESWYTDTKSKCDLYLKNKRKIQLEKELKELQ